MHKNSCLCFANMNPMYFNKSLSHNTLSAVHQHSRYSTSVFCSCHTKIFDCNTKLSPTYRPLLILIQNLFTWRLKLSAATVQHVRSVGLLQRLPLYTFLCRTLIMQSVGVHVWILDPFKKETLTWNQTAHSTSHHTWDQYDIFFCKQRLRQQRWVAGCCSSLKLVLWAAVPDQQCSIQLLNRSLSAGCNAKGGLSECHQI